MLQISFQLSCSNFKIILNEAILISVCMLQTSGYDFIFCTSPFKIAYCDFPVKIYRFRFTGCAFPVAIFRLRFSGYVFRLRFQVTVSGYGFRLRFQLSICYLCMPLIHVTSIFRCYCPSLNPCIVLLILFPLIFFYTFQNHSTLLPLDGDVWNVEFRVIFHYVHV
jgi:hypothetical protein